MTVQTFDNVAEICVSETPKSSAVCRAHGWEMQVCLREPAPISAYSKETIEDSIPALAS